MCTEVTTIITKARLRILFNRLHGVDHGTQIANFIFREGG